MAGARQDVAPRGPRRKVVATLTVSLPPCRSTSLLWARPLIKFCARRAAPTDAQGNYENLINDELHSLRAQRGYSRKDSRAASKTRLETIDATERKRARETRATVDTSEESLEVCEKT